MTTDAVAALEYEAMIFGRHLTQLPGRSRRQRGVLDESAYTLLSLLEAGGAMSIGELSATTGLDASTLNRQTAALLKQAHVDRIPDPGGGIARKFRATAEGVRMLRDERDASRAALANLTADWSPAERDALVDLLGRLNRAIEERSGRRWPRPSSRA